MGLEKVRYLVRILLRAAVKERCNSVCWGEVNRPRSCIRGAYVPGTQSPVTVSMLGQHTFRLPHSI